MTNPTYSSYAQWYSEGHLAPYVHTMKSPGGILSLVEAKQPPGDMSDPAVPEIVLYQDLIGGTQVSGNLGGGNFTSKSKKGGFFLAAPNFANTTIIDQAHQLRAVSFPLAYWQTLLDGGMDGQFEFDRPEIHNGTFSSPIVHAAMLRLWSLSEEEDVPSRLLAQAAGSEILAELCRLSGQPFTPATGGLAPWAERRCLELIHARYREDISLEELAAEARLSLFHFARMFKQSIGVPPRVYMTRLRMEKACELLKYTDLPITEIAFEVGYSSNQVLARIFSKYHNMTPTDYRRAFGDPTHLLNININGSALERDTHTSMARA